CRQVYPSLANVSTVSVPSDVEEESDAIFERIYRGVIAIPQVIELLKKYRDSSSPREVQVYEYFTQVLFEESTKFWSYPDMHLQLTSVLFGCLIQNVFVVSTLWTALHYVLEALRQPVTSKLFEFGTQALTQFQTRLVEWPRYCQLLLSIEHLHEAHPEVVAYIKSLEAQPGQARPGAEGAEEQMMMQQQQQQQQQHQQQLQQQLQQQHQQQQQLQSAGEGGVSLVEREGAQQTVEAPVFTALKLDTLIEASDKDAFEVPNEATQDKILFIINNVSETNVEQKVGEMREILRETHFRWFSHYMVVKRSSIEPNFHGLYIDFLEGLSQPALQRNILHETFSNIKILLNSEKTVTSSSERSLLKNLGTWLGRITLAKNKPIKHKNLAFKDLLLEGYDSDRLIVVIPFACKVLEQCRESKVFKPPNPWLMAIMKLMAELYHFADLKLNLKFEVEVLCKELKLDIKEIENTTILRTRQTKAALTTNPFAKPGPDESPQLSAGVVAGAGLGLGLGGPALPVSHGDEQNVGYPNLAMYITFNPNLPIFNAQPSLKRIVFLAIDRAIREQIINPVVERSVTIASIASRELVLKDFALEPNEDKMRKASHLMVQNLAGSLAAVSSREPLRVSMMSQLRSLLLQNGFTEQSIPEQVVYIIVADNLDLACSVMEKAAADKATLDIDETLAGAYLNRRKHRERTNQPYYDVAVYAASRYPSSLPELLRLKSGGLSATQAMLAELEKVASSSGTATLATLPAQHEVPTLLRQISVFVFQMLDRDEIVLILCHKIVHQLYACDSSLARECYVILLERLFEISKRARKEVSSWFLFADDDRKFNLDVFAVILQGRLISAIDLDMQLARAIESGRTSLLDFSADLIRRTVLPEQPVVAKDGFYHTVDILTKLKEKGQATESVSAVIDELSKQFSVSLTREAAREDPLSLRDKLGMLFQEWVRIYHHPSSNDKTHAAFVLQMQQQGILSEDVASLFFRICTELSVESYIKAKAANAATPGGPHTAPFHAVDAFARLIVLLVLHFSEPVGSNPQVAKLNRMTKILSIVVLVLVHSHEQRRERFNQRPFFRLFSTLLNDLNMHDEHLHPLSFQILSAISNTLHTLQPSFLPGFTFSWVQLISHRFFMPKLLQAENQKGWPFFQRLLVDVFKFLNPFLRQPDMIETTRLLYKATLRILLVLLHDFPEFLCDYHFSFVDVIPGNCIQLRNLILSAFPKSMRLPDPFTPNLKVDLLPEINQPPHVLSDYTSSLVPSNFKNDIDTYLKTRGPVSFLLDLRSRLLLPASAAPEYGVRYSIPVINALVLYVGIQAITQAQSKPLQGSPPMTHSAPMDIFQQLIVDLDTEGRYLFLTAIANQLRYPNSHTHYFSCVLLYLFAEANQEIVQEQITR
ncbi:hypothetical protein HK101_003252, partial [Irineochytrium annulatum]